MQFWFIPSLARSQQGGQSRASVRACVRAPSCSAEQHPLTQQPTLSSTVKLPACDSRIASDFCDRRTGTRSAASGIRPIAARSTQHAARGNPLSVGPSLSSPSSLLLIVNLCMSEAVMQAVRPILSISSESKQSSEANKDAKIRFASRMYRQAGRDRDWAVHTAIKARSRRFRLRVVCASVGDVSDPEIGGWGCRLCAAHRVCIVPTMSDGPDTAASRQDGFRTIGGGNASEFPLTAGHRSADWR